MTHLGTRVAAYVDGQLSADEEAAARTHLEDCGDCRDAVEEQRRLKARTASAARVPVPPPGLVHSLCDLGRLGVQAEPAPRVRDRATAVLTGVRAGATVLLAGTTVGVAACAWSLGGTPAATGAPTVPPVERFVADFGAPAAAPQGGVVQAALARVGSGTAGGDAVTVRAPGDDPQAVALIEAAGATVPDAAALVATTDVQVGGTGLIEGEPATEVVATRDGRRSVAYWLGRTSGQAVRVVAYDRDGTPRERPVTTEAAAADGGTPLSEAAMVSLTRSGWPCHESLASDLERVEGALVDAGSADSVVSLEYADDVSRLALHEQAGTLDAERLRGFATTRLGGTEVWLRQEPGGPTVATWDRDGIVYTVVTDADRARLADVVADLPHVAPAGPVDRVERGLVRMSRWADPLGR